MPTFSCSTALDDSSFEQSMRVNADSEKEAALKAVRRYAHQDFLPTYIRIHLQNEPDSIFFVFDTPEGILVDKFL